MKKTIISIVLVIAAVLPSLPGNGQSAVLRVGVLPLYDTAQQGKTPTRAAQGVASEITSALAQYKFLGVVDRSAMEALFKEVELGQAGVVDPATAARLGRVQGIQVLVTGAIVNGRLTARAVHLETQRVIATAAAPDAGHGEILAAAIAAGIEAFMARENLKRLRNENPDIAVRFWAERGAGERVDPARGGLRVGDTVRFRFTADRDGYLTLVNIQADGEVIVLYPNDFHPDNAVRKGQVYTVPGDDDGFEITVGEPAGIETVTAFFTTKKVAWLDRKELQGTGLASVRQKSRYEFTARGLKITGTQLSKKEWKSSVLEIEVKP